MISASSNSLCFSSQVFLPVFSHPFGDVESIDYRQSIGSNLKILFLSFVHAAVDDGFIEHVDGFER